MFTGAGASVELGIPAMRLMAEQFRDHLHDLSLPVEVIDKIDKLVGDASNDMEHAIDVIDGLERGFRARLELGESPDEAEIAPYLTIRQEAEWFVQHCCEQIKAESAIKMWSPALLAASGIALTIASTNYDRAVEIAAARLAIHLEDGFDDFGGKEYANWQDPRDNEDIKLLKLHGSTDWYRTDSDQIFKLRHPMPLFGKLQIVPEELSENRLHSALILPSREKLTTLYPFPVISTEFRQRAKEADIAIFLGSSLRDPHMRDVCVSCASKKPTYVVSRSGDFENDVVPDQAVVIRQGAGRFLVSTFPRFLRNQDVTILDSASDTSEPDTTNVLQWLVRACDESRDPINRCDSIESLADAGISLHKREIELLLTSSSDEVSTFALGLVLSSCDRDTLIDVAKDIATEREASRFNAELDILLQLVNQA